MVSPSRCPPWQPERPGPTRREPRRAQRSYTTRRDTISIFRLIVGTALIERGGLDCPTWDNRGTVSREVRERERHLETAVSKVIGEMPFFWLAVEDAPGPASLRGFIERNAIALLSNRGKQPIDLPSRSWLGHHCNREKVRGAGLWNSNHVEEPYDPTFLDTLADLIKQVEKGD